MRKSTTLVLSALLLATTATSQQLLYDNGPLITHPGGGSGGADASALENTTLGLNVYGFGLQRTATIDNRVSDSFFTCGVVLQRIEFFAYQTNSTTASTITETRVALSTDSPEDANYLNTPALFGDKTLGTNFQTSTTWAGIYRTLESNVGTATNRPIMSVIVDINPPVVLPQGRYYLYWQHAGSLASGPWVPPITVLGQRVTGDARQHINATPPGTWQDMLSGGNRQGMPFKLFGVPSGSVGSAVTYGIAKAGTNGIPAWTTQVPYPGADLYPIEITNGLNGSSPIVIVGSGRTNIPFPPFGTIYTAPAFSFSMAPFANGATALRLTVPSTCGGPINMQAFFADPGAAGGIAHTDGLELTIGN